MIVFVALVKRVRTITDYATVRFSATSASYAEKDAIAKVRCCASDELPGIFSNESIHADYKVLTVAPESEG